MKPLPPPFGLIFWRKLLSLGAENALVQGPPGRRDATETASEFMMEV